MITTLNNSIPESLNPVESPIYFASTSDWYTVQDFKYLWKIYSLSRVDNSTIDLDLGVYLTAPTPEGLGLFSPHDVLKTTIDEVYEPCISVTYSLTTSDWVPFKIYQGFDVSLNFQYYDTGFYSGNLGLTFSYKHNLVPGMFIEIRTGDPFNTSYNGLSAKINSVGNTFLVTDQPFGNSGPVVHGQVLIPFNTFFRATTPYQDYLGLSFSGTHMFQVGDYIVVNKDDKTWNNDYDGEWLVKATSSNTLILDRYFGATYSFGAESGYVDRLSRLENISSVKYAFTAAREYDEINTSFTTEFLNKQALSNYTWGTQDEFKNIPLGQYESMRLWLTPSVWKTLHIKRWYFNGNTSILSRNFAESRSLPTMVHIGCGTANVLNVFGSTALDNVIKYEIYLSDIPIS